MIDILLATYNGEKYINQQIESILGQTHKDWKLIVHDDGSSDNTIHSIKEYVSKHPEKIVFIEDGIKTGGAKNNFVHLMNFSTAPYIMFCDQDDVWKEDRIEKFYQTMLEAEQIYNNIPLLVFSDLTVADEQLNLISPSMIQYQKLNPKIAQSFDLLKCQNVITGCAMMMNKKALESASPIPDNILMHDWWIGLTTAKYGKNIFLNQQTILYRQHSNNAVGSKRVDLKRLTKIIFSKKIFIDYINIKKMIMNLGIHSFTFYDFICCKIHVNLLRFFGRIE